MEPIQIVEGGRLRRHEDHWLVERDGGKEMILQLPRGRQLLMRRERRGRFVLPLNEGDGGTWQGDTALWFSAGDAAAAREAWLLTAEPAARITVEVGARTIVQSRARRCVLRRYEARPRADCTGNRFSFAFEGSGAFSEALAAFYWGTLLPCVVERTRAKDYPVSDGFVLSTLSSHSYDSTYPDVDHEFQIKGRLAMGNPVDEDIARRMIELQLKLMREDPQGLWRNPCALLPNGDRQYHVRRNSRSGRTNAEMFLITGNVEVLESAWLYVAATKDDRWLAAHIADLEGAASWVEAQVDRQGRLWSDVYFEDQVMQDGRVCDAQAFAANGFRLLASLEARLRRTRKAGIYRRLEAHLAASLIAPVPGGYWDGKNGRFVNWVDRHGRVHDHEHLLSNILPLLFGYASAAQQRRVLRLIDRRLDEFQRFPSFLAADIAAYTEDEIGDGGPYDLCAAGRYWCWDAAFWSWRRDRRRLRRQLEAVARQAKKDCFVMGERYDMDYVYYVDGRDWHGAAHYYEYPCVFAWVLLHEFLGVRHDLRADLRIAPRLDCYGGIELAMSRFAVGYEYGRRAFVLRNLAPRARAFAVDLGALYPRAHRWRVTCRGRSRVVRAGGTVAIPAEAEAVFTVLDG